MKLQLIRDFTNSIHFFNTLEIFIKIIIINIFNYD